jgi:hypothetical protein
MKFPYPVLPLSLFITIPPVSLVTIAPGLSGAGVALLQAPILSIPVNKDFEVPLPNRRCMASTPDKIKSPDFSRLCVLLQSLLDSRVVGTRIEQGSLHPIISI